jgi:NAD(P)-dependent dehydrogenase (short-subunit alcohol dehydrogenase family)
LLLSPDALRGQGEFIIFNEFQHVRKHDLPESRYICARTCALKGAHVFMLNRKSSRSEAASKRITEDAPGAQVTPIECDLMDFESVSRAAAELKSLLGEKGVDVLCNNAGVMALEDQATKDGYDVQMQTNHLSHFLLTKEIFPLLEKAADLRGEARIVQHSSGARKYPTSALDASYFGKNGGNLGGNGNSMIFGGARWQRYHQTKLANAVFMVALAEKLEAKGSKVKSLCAAPGLAATNLQVSTAADGGMDSTWIMRFSQSAEDGTMPLLTCVAGAGSQNGHFYEPAGITGPATRKDLEAICTNAQSRKLLWEESEKACGTWDL